MQRAHMQDARRPSPERPFISVNVAITADGKIAFANGHYVPFGSAHDHALLLRLRAQADAVLVGARTVNLYPINLGPGAAKYRRQRLQRGLSEYNLRVVLSGRAHVESNAEIFRHTFSPIIIITTARAPRSNVKRLLALGAHVEVCGEQDVDWAEALRILQNKWGVRRLLCEGGGETNAALFALDMVDQLHVTVCPRIFGGKTAPTLADGRGVDKLAEAAQLTLHSMRRVGDELFLVYGRNGS